MKKLITFLIVIALTVALIPATFVSAADQTFTVNVENSEIYYDEDREVVVYINANATFRSVSLSLNYDPEVLVYEGYSSETDKFDYSAKSSRYDENGDPNGKIGFSAIGLSRNITLSNENLFKVVFSVNENITDEEIASSLSLELDSDLWMHGSPAVVYTGNVQLNPTTIELCKNNESETILADADLTDDINGEINEVE